MSKSAGDPGRIHSEGMTSRVAVEAAREQVAGLLGARAREVVFTSGATEAITSAVWGAVSRSEQRRHVVFSAVEHSAVRESSIRHWTAGSDYTEVGVDGKGRVDPDEILAAVRSDTALVHIQWGNHEVGTLQPVFEVVERCREAGILVHVDAAQAVGHLPVDFKALGADLMSVSAHKFGGPTGVGALVVRRGLRLDPLFLGGDQERARRAGMENVVGIVGFGAAAVEVDTNLATECERYADMTRQIVRWAEGADGVTVLGAVEDRLPHLVCLGISEMEPQPVLLGLDQRGTAVHSGSSCSTEALEPSPVLEAMGVDAKRSLRISVGWSNTADDVDRLLKSLPLVLDEIRSLRSEG